jgi:hypothetical protein
MISERLDEALATAERRLAEFEVQIESQIQTRVGELERSLRAPQT